jgi:hypothetical protein
MIYHEPYKLDKKLGVRTSNNVNRICEMEVKGSKNHRKNPLFKLI